MRYEFRNLTTGRSCCRSDDIRHLCPRCLSQAVASLEAAARRPVSALVAAPITVAASAPEEPPAPPSLIARVGGPEVMMAPVYGGGPRRRPLVTASTGDVPAAPSLADAIIAARQGARR